MQRIYITSFDVSDRRVLFSIGNDTRLGFAMMPAEGALVIICAHHIFTNLTCKVMLKDTVDLKAGVEFDTT